MTRAHTTLVGILGDSLVRADFSSGRVPTLRHLERFAVVPGGDLASSLERALLTGGRPGRRVFILSTEFTTQSLELMVPGSGLSDDETRSALSFEAEAESGIPVAESSLGFRPITSLDGRKLHWLTQTQESVLHTCDEICQRARTRLAGLLHPGGMPMEYRVDEKELPPAASWRRVEVWQKAIFLLEGKPNTPIKMSVVATGSRPSDWRAESAGAFPNPSPAPSVWVGPGIEGALESEIHMLAGPITPATDGNLHDLESPTTMSRWLTGWARVLSDPAPAVPMIVPPEREMAASRRLGIAVGIAAAVALGLFVHSRWQAQKEINLKQQLVIAKQPAQAMASLTAATAQLTAQANSLIASNQLATNQLIEWKELKTLQRHRHAGLLSTFAATLPETLMLSQITDRGREVVVQGFTTSPKLESVINDLDRALAPIGWEVQIPTQEAKGWLPDGGPWAVAFRFTPSGIRKVTPDTTAFGGETQNGRAARDPVDRSATARSPRFAPINPIEPASNR